MGKKKESTTIRCDFDGGLHMPKICVSCGAYANEKRHEFDASNSMKTSKVKIKFPVCDSCYEAEQSYINAVPVTIFGTIAFFFSVFSLFHGSEKIPSGIYLVGGILWLAIIAAYVVWTNIRANRHNTPDIISRRAKLRNAIEKGKFTPSGRNSTGEITLTFKNAHFAEKFKSMNKGQVIKK